MLIKKPRESLLALFDDNLCYRNYTSPKPFNSSNSMLRARYSERPHTSFSSILSLTKVVSVFVILAAAHADISRNYYDDNNAPWQDPMSWLQVRSLLSPAPYLNIDMTPFCTGLFHLFPSLT